jgi:phosphoglycolate phosphatase
VPIVLYQSDQFPEEEEEDTPPMAPQLLSSSNFKSLFDSVDTFLFDCDGVIWKGETLIDGVSQTLDLIRSKVLSLFPTLYSFSVSLSLIFCDFQGKNVVFVTNNSVKSRRQYAEKFRSLGVTSITQDEIFSSSFAAAMYLKVNNFPKDKKVYVIGGEGVLEELQIAGFTGLGGPEDGEKKAQWKSNSLFEHDKSVGAVVVGLDPNINYYKLQ